jgi:hypothetical protein
MNRSFLLAFAMAAVAGPALAQDPVPYASRPSTLSDAYVPALAYIMDDVQTRHIKLWFAGKNRNWMLAAYELNQLLGRFNEAIRFYRSIPVAEIEAADGPLVELKNAINAKAGAQFDTAFGKVTAACNSCHDAAEIGFVTITKPSSSPYSDQSFAPRQK